MGRTLTLEAVENIQCEAGRVAALAMVLVDWLSEKDLGERPIDMAYLELARAMRDSAEALRDLVDGHPPQPAA
jgi:hypothetical protein